MPDIQELIFDALDADTEAIEELSDRLDHVTTGLEAEIVTLRDNNPQLDVTGLQGHLETIQSIADAVGEKADPLRADSHQEDQKDPAVATGVDGAGVENPGEEAQGIGGQAPASEESGSDAPAVSVGTLPDGPFKDEQASQASAGDPEEVPVDLPEDDSSKNPGLTYPEGSVPLEDQAYPPTTDRQDHPVDGIPPAPDGTDPAQPGEVGQTPNGEPDLTDPPVNAGEPIAGAPASEPDPAADPASDATPGTAGAGGTITETAPADDGISTDQRVG